MKHITFLVSNKKELKKAIKISKDKLYKSVLIQVYMGITDKKKIQKTIDNLSEKFENAIIIGSTTAGGIIGTNIYDDNTVISLSLFEHTKLKAQYVKKIDNDGGEKLSKKLCSKTTKATLILSEGLNGKDYDGFIKGFNSKNPKVIIAGGLAGDDFQLKKTYVFLDGNIYNEGSVAVSFSSKKLYADNRYNLNWTPIGKKFIITKAVGNIVYEIDGVSAVKHFKKYLGSHIFKNNASSLSDFQLLYENGKTIVSRTPMAVDNDAIIFASAIKEGQEVQFGFSNGASVLSGSNQISNIIKNKPAEAIYIFSCIARKKLLGKVLGNEFASFNNIALSSGFFTYGEYYSTSVNNAVLNCTTTLLILSESSTANKNVQKREFSSNSLEDNTFNSLTHFIKQTSKELESNIKLLNQYKDVVDASLLISKTDLKGHITYVNDNFCRTSKYSPKELLGQEHNIIRSSKSSSFTFKKMWTTIRKGKVWSGELVNRAKDGSEYYVAASIMPIHNKDGIIKEYIAIRQDITKQVLAKNRMRKKEKFIKAIFDNQDSIVIYSSLENGMRSVNKAFFDAYDYKNLEDFKSKHSCICDLFIDEDGYYYPNRNIDWQKEISNDEQNDYKVKMLAKDGEVHTYNLKVKMIEDEYILNLSDISNLEKALQKAYSSEHMKSMFLANMSHEIRTPLNGILGFTDILRRKKLDTESEKYIDIIHKSGKTLLNVVNDILDFSKIESGELSLYEIDSELFYEMEAVVSTFASSAKAKHINYFTYIDTNIPKVLKCDAQRLKQVMSNLISNAIKFTPNKGNVQVDVYLKDVSKNSVIIHFSVKDSGIGISDKKISTIFKPFSQADNSISREFGGTGLGLAISSQYIEMMDSRIEVSSKEKLGSKFCFDVDFKVVNMEHSIEKEVSLFENKISILQPNNLDNCEIYNVIINYLNAWRYKHTKIDSVNELNSEPMILIVSSILFTIDECVEILDKNSNIELIYMEGSHDSIESENKKLHIMKQPIIGSNLFDIIASIVNTTDKVETYLDDSIEQFNANILIAEDNETNQMLISVMLNQRGINYKIVENGEEAVSEAFKDDYTLIFMDINMPVMDGITATKILRERKYNKPIVSLSADVIESDIKIMKEAGVDDSLNKPIVPAELDNILKKYTTNQDDIIVEEIDGLNYDVVDAEKLSKSLSINNVDIAKKLLNSFSESTKEIIVKIKENELNKDILHSLKGLSGNLRFNNLYDFIVDLENIIDELDVDEKMVVTKNLLSHLKEAIKGIESLNH